MKPELLTALKWTLMGLAPAAGETAGNFAFKQKLAGHFKSLFGSICTDEDYELAKESLVAHGLLQRRSGRGGAISRRSDTTENSFGPFTDEIALALVLELLPQDTSTKSNKAMESEVADLARSRFGVAVSKPQYQGARDILQTAMLLEKGQGYTGTVRRSQQPIEIEGVNNPNGTEVESYEHETVVQGQTPRAHQATVRTEGKLYAPLKQILERDWLCKHGVLQDDALCEVTANQGARDTGGKWTRPDLSLIAVRTYDFIPGRTLEVTTFEVKPLDTYSVDGIFETASHSVYANRSYLLLHVDSANSSKPTFDRIFGRLEKLAARFGVGLMTFHDPADWSTFKLHVDAVHNVPDPADTSEFISDQISNAGQAKIRKLIRF